MRNEYKLFGTKGSITVPRAFRPDNHDGEGLVVIETNGVSQTKTITSDQYKGQMSTFRSDTRMQGRSNFITL